MRVLRFILENTEPYRRYLLGSIFAIFLVAANKNINPYLTKTIIDTVNANDYESVWIIILLYGITQFLLVCVWNFYDFCTSKYTPQLTTHITKAILHQISLYPYRFFQEHLSGSITSKISDAAKFAPQLVSTIILEFFQISLMIIMSMILLIKVHYCFGIAMIIWLTIFVTIAYLKIQKACILSNEESEADASIWGRVVDYLANIFSVKLFSSRFYENNRLNHDLKAFVSKNMEMHLFLRSYFSLQGIVFSCYIILCLCGMTYLSKHHLITSGDFALVLMLNIVIVDWLFGLTNIIRTFITNWGAVDQALEILEDIPEIEDKEDAKTLNVTKGEIVFDQVKFHYRGTEALFDKKSVTIYPGEKVGLVGYSGGGKTTFVNLILRLFDIHAGRILIDDQDICDVTQDSLRNNIAMIPQDPSLFHRSVMENIRYGKVGAGDEEVINAAKKAHAHDFIMKLPFGYESLVGANGVKLSGGQRQRIAIARAILKNAHILILDEATSQLDSVTEADIQDSLWKLMQNKTTIVIAHRLSTLLHMDRILVFEKGKIIADGSHTILLATSDLYKNLWEAQKNGFLPDKKEKN